MKPVISVTPEQVKALYNQFVLRIYNEQHPRYKRDSLKKAENFLNFLSMRHTVVGPHILWNYFVYHFQLKTEKGKQKTCFNDFIGPSNVSSFFNRKKVNDIYSLTDYSFFSKYKLSEHAIFDIVFSEKKESETNQFMDPRTSNVKNQNSALMKCYLTTAGFDSNNSNCKICQHQKICRSITLA